MLHVSVFSFILKSFSHRAGMVGETGDATERFLRSAAKGEVDPRASLNKGAAHAKARAAEPAPAVSKHLSTCEPTSVPLSSPKVQHVTQFACCIQV